MGLVARGWLAPRLVARYLQHELTQRGFPDARLRVVDVGLDHVRLADVRLGDGLALGDVELDAGWSLLWRSARALTLHGAQLTSATLARWTAGSASPAPALGKLPFTELRVAASTLDVGGARFAVSGRVDLRRLDAPLELRATTPALQVGALALRDVVVTARGAGEGIRVCASAVVDARTTAEACAPLSRAAPLATRAFDVEASVAADGWTARGRGRVVWDGRELRVDAGAVEARGSFAADGVLRVHDAQVTGTIDGRLTAARELRIDRAAFSATARSVVSDTFRLGDARVGGALARALSAAVAARQPTLQLDDVRVTGRLAGGTTGGGALRVDTIAFDATAARAAGEAVAFDDARVQGTSTGARIEPTGVHVDGSTVDVAAARGAIGELRLRDLRLDGTTTAMRIAADGARVDHASLKLDATTATLRDLHLEGMRVASRLAGEARELAIDGTVRARRGAIRGPHHTHLVDATLPFRLRAGIVARARTGATTRGLIATRPLVAKAASATLLVADSIAQAKAPVMTVRAAGALPLAALVQTPKTIPWRAEAVVWRGLAFADASGRVSLARPGDVQHIQWARVGGSTPVPVGAGEAAVREIAGRPEVTAGRARVLGGTLAVGPHQPASGDLVLDVRGLSLAKLLGVAGKAVAATGVVDGTLVVAAGERGCSLRRLSLWARAPGVLRVRDPQLRAAWAEAARARISARVQGALADFAYTELSLMVQPPNADPEVRLELRGHGRQVQQSLDLVINLHGVRAAVHKLVARVSRQESP